jgi:hypothetical protein
VQVCQPVAGRPDRAGDVALLDFTWNVSRVRPRPGWPTASAISTASAAEVTKLVTYRSSGSRRSLTSRSSAYAASVSRVEASRSTSAARSAGLARQVRPVCE